MTESYAQQQDPQDPRGEKPPATTTWTDRVTVSDRGYAYRPDELVVIGQQAASAAAQLVSREAGEPAKIVPLRDNDLRVTAPGPISVERIVADLRHVGFKAEPNYVLFGHNCGAGPCGCSCCGGASANPVYANPVYANPVYANPVYANPVYANPVYANPVYANSVYASPVYANPVYANPVYANYINDGVRPSSARPAQDPGRDTPILPDATDERIFILDTGIAAEDDLPDLIQREPITRAPERDHEAPDENGDDLLDPAAGHGTFIAGIIEQLAPGRHIEVHGVLTTLGDGPMTDIVARLDSLVDSGRLNDRSVVNLSFGGYADGEMMALAASVRRVQAQGAVVVASSGNDGICVPQFPAALPDVVAVASIDPTGPAPYSNHGPWVRACAPGTDVVSSFFREYDGGLPVPPVPGSADPDFFQMWARWTGTSFAAPIVAAALVRQMALTGDTAAHAVEQIIDAPGLFRIPNFGTVVNLSLS